MSSISSSNADPVALDSDSSTSFHQEETSDDIDAMFASCGYEAEDLRDTLQAERDVLGSTQQQQQPAEAAILENATRGLKEALATLPQERRRWYDAAVQRAPKIVQLETPPERYLKACDYNFWQAAERIADYWTLRVEAFGEERYCLPLRLGKHTLPSSSENINQQPPQQNDSMPQPPRALSQRTVNVLANGVFTFLPPDKYNRPVVMLDRERYLCLSQEEADSIYLEMWFYIFQLASESDLSRSHGCVGILAEASDEAAGSKAKPNGTFTKVLRSQAFPMIFKAVHFLAVRKPSSISQYCLQTYISCVQRLKYLKSRFRAHYLASVEQILPCIQDYGLDNTHLPQRFGGTADFSTWYQKLLQQEEQRYAFLSQATPVTTTPTDMTVASTTSSSPATSLPPSAHDSPAEMARQSEMKRKMEDFRQWADDHLIRHKTARLKSTAMVHEMRRDALQEQNDILQAQLTCATYMIQQFEQDQAQIIQFLEPLASPMVNNETNEDIDDSKSPQDMAETLLKTYVVFHGRDSASGDWKFSTPPGLTPEQRDISMGLQLFLWGEQRRQQSLEQQVVTMDPQAAATVISDVDSEDETEDLDHQLSALQAQVDALTKSTDSKKEEQSFLQSSVVFSSHLTESFDQFKRLNVDSLVGLYVALLKHIAALSAATQPEMNQQLMYAQASKYADHVLTHYTSFNGSKFINAAVVLAESFESDPNQTDAPLYTSLANFEQEQRTKEDRRNQSLASNPQAVEYLMSLCTDGATESLRPSATTATAQESRQQEEEQLVRQLEEEARRRKQHRLQRKKLLKRL